MRLGQELFALFAGQGHDGFLLRLGGAGRFAAARQYGPYGTVFPQDGDGRRPTGVNHRLPDRT
ncbi:hypothetical protein SHKM778_88170 [Streptomyces sp. KM77-8]|uniref:Uncharacterized protein n=1 Tax=Streptomyces haneummycinicus TaxID=3074435 RepID=A0AAT9HZP4_9ACTN